MSKVIKPQPEMGTSAANGAKPHQSANGAQHTNGHQKGAAPHDFGDGPVGDFSTATRDEPTFRKIRDDFPDFDLATHPDVNAPLLLVWKLRCQHDAIHGASAVQEGIPLDDLVERTLRSLLPTNPNAAPALSWLRNPKATFYKSTDAQSVARKFIKNCTPSTQSEPREKKSQAEALLEIALNEAEIFRDKDDEPFAIIETKRGARLTYRLNSTTFRSWISARHYEIHGRMVSSSSAFASVLDTLRGSLMGQPAREIYTRIAHLDGRIIYDLGDESGRAVEITPEGWTVCDVPPVAFIRPKGMRPQVEPQRGGCANELRELLNVETEDDFKLTLGFTIGFFQPEGAKSHLAFLGEQGTAKTATTKTIRTILDPNDAPTRSEPREIGDLIVGAKNNAILGFDNLSHIPQWFSDTLCRFSTGSGDGKRKLYVDDEEVIFAFKRSVIFNAITDVATKPDLLDRTILIELPVLAEGKRRRESNLDRDFAQSRPLILGALFDAVAQGLGRLSTVEVKNLPRMADFAAWVEACAPGLGWEEGEFLEIYRKNRASTTDSAAEISTLISFIVELWTTKAEPPFEGSPNELLELLNRAAKPNYAAGDATDIRAAKDWPKDAASLGRTLKRFAPIMRAKHVQAQSGTSNSKRVWRITVEKTN